MGPPTRRIIAKQALELEIKSELLKKRPHGVSYRTQEKVTLMNQYQQQVTRLELCQWLDIPRSVSYYLPKSGVRGAKPSQMTRKKDGTWVSNDEVVDRIRQLLNTEFNAFGYEYTSHELKKDYIINKKKRGRPAVYRLMNENGLLLGKVIRPTGKREFVKFRRIEATRHWNTSDGSPLRLGHQVCMAGPISMVHASNGT